MSERRYAIVGGKFRPPALGVIASLPVGFSLLLKREPDNKFDHNAIKVILVDSDALAKIDAELLSRNIEGYGFTRDDLVTRGPIHLGYIPRDNAGELARIVDTTGISQWPGTFTTNVEGQPRVSFDIEAIVAEGDHEGEDEGDDDIEEEEEENDNDD